MIRTKGFLVGLVLLVSANFAFSDSDEIDDKYVKVDFIENLNENASLDMDRIVSGWDALPGQHPHVVSLRHVNRTGFVAGCGGVLIHQHWVLTAAHCIARVSLKTKREMVQNMQKQPKHKVLKRLDDETCDPFNQLQSFFTQRTATLFVLLINNGREKSAAFLAKDPSEWLTDEIYIEMKEKAHQMKVENDCAEHGIGLITKFNVGFSATGAWIIRAGVTDLTKPEYISETNVAHVYPMYDLTRPLAVQPDDIALVRLMQPVPYTKLARPIRIQSRADAFHDNSGQVAYASGFGRTSTNGTSTQVLQWVFLNLTSNEECSEVYGELITPNNICAGPFNVTSQSICHGDSGGPLVYLDDDGLPTLIGISSFVMGGEYGCHSGFPSAFVRPGAFHNWISEVTGLDFENLDSEEEDLEITTEEPTTKTNIPTTTIVPEPESIEDIDQTSEETEESKEETEDSNEETKESSEPEEESEEESSEDPEFKDLLKHLEVQVNVKLKINKFKKKHEVHIKHERENRKKHRKKV